MMWSLPNRRPTQCLTFAIVLLACTSGCQTLYGYRPFSVEVRDIETKKPLPGARVHISYPMADSPFAPSDGSKATGADGIAHLQAAPYGEAGIAVDVTAGGYLPGEKSLSVAAVQALAPAHLFETVERRPVSLVVELYAEPRPAIELVLPVGYRGVVKAEILIQDDAPCQPGQRLFSGVMAPSGVVPVTGPPLLRCLLATDTRARFADGTQVSRQPNETEVGLWWINSESVERHAFFVGTKAEYDSYRRSSRAEGGEEKRSSSGGKSGGRGRGGRRGGPSSSDPTASGATP